MLQSRMMAVAGFWVAIGYILYVLAGYPALLGVFARWRAKRILRRPINPSVSVIIAVHNGERFIEPKLRSVLDLAYPRDKMEIIVASDGSTDRTEEITHRFAGDGVRLLALPHAGKPSALNAAMAEAHGEILIFTDVRQLLASDSLRLLVENFADPAVGAASAELVILKGGIEEANVGLYWRYELWIRLRLSALDSIFGATGAYYGIRRQLAAPIPPDALLDDMYVPLPAFFEGYRLIVDSRARMFDYPSGIESEFRRKLRTLAGNYQILRTYPQLLGPRNRMWFHYVSYKFGRLLLPYALIVVAILSFELPAPWSARAVGCQMAFYLAALADRWIPEGFFFKRLTSPIRTFVTLMAAALLAVSVVFVPASVLWRPSRIQRPT